ncbi:MAG: hypothetical protein Q4D06_02695 [Coriobacteriia bacterium]|nr:hypothetical protein [Coriobacteriia bacterium]
MSEMHITNPAAIETDDVKVKIFKHHLSSRIAHGCVALGFCAAAITGVLLFLGVDMSRGAMALVHALGGLLLTVAALVYSLTNFKFFSRFVATCLHYDKDDLGWITAPMGGYLDPYLFRNQPPHYVPPQDKYNTGQKGAGVVLFVGTLILAITGFLMWANTSSGIFGIIKISLAPGTTWLLWRAHLLVCVVTLCVFAVHFFLGAIYPVTNVEFGTMFGNGIADYKYTKKKHGKWLQTLEVMEEKELDAPAEKKELEEPADK